jgi:BirA family biotin operon repressor/biotin-[acetyl-CoA-carboxylase] ligase
MAIGADSPAFFLETQPMDERPLPPSDTDRPLDVAALESALAGTRLGHPILYFPAIGSTNTHAMELARAGAAEGTLVTTDDQTSGRGRVGRSWLAMPYQQLALSVVLRPSFPPHFLVMASALAVAGAIEEITGLRPGIKWPNDVLLAGRKVCGILIETSGDVAVLGIGLNVNGSLAGHPEFAAKAATLADALGHGVSREALAASLLKRLDADYAALQGGGEDARAGLRAAWRARLVTLGTHVTIRQNNGAIEGLAEDVNADGALLVRAADGVLRAVTWGDVE